MMNYFFKSVLFLTILLFSAGLKGQLNYQNGIIVTNENDTIKGLIHDGSTKRNSKYCLFKVSTISEKIKYFPSDIKAYRLSDNKFYKTKKAFLNSDSSLVFMAVLLEGKINLYYYYKNKGLQYFLEKTDGNLIGLENKNISDNSSGMIISYMPRTTFNINIYKDTLLSVFRDCKRIHPQVETVNYNQKSLINITKAYINETCKEAICIKYEKDISLTKPRSGVYTGIQFSRVEWIQGVKSKLITSIPIAVFYNVPIRIINDRFSFQFEFVARNLNYRQLYSNSDGSDCSIEVKSRTLGIPLAVKYTISNSPVSPTIGFGKETSFLINSNVIFNNEVLSTFKTQYGGWFFETGLNYKLYKKHSVFTNLRIQKNSDLVERTYVNPNIPPLPWEQVSFNYYKTGFASLHFGVKF